MRSSETGWEVRVGFHELSALVGADYWIWCGAGGAVPVAQWRSEETPIGWTSSLRLDHAGYGPCPSPEWSAALYALRFVCGKTSRMRRLLLLIALLLSASLVLQACTVRGGRGGRGGSDDDDDDSAANDDDASDDDDVADDDDVVDDDDDDGAGPQEVSGATGSWITEFDFSPEMNSELGWNDCVREILFEQVSGEIDQGAPGDYVMRMDSTSIFVDCAEDTGITDTPFTGVQFSTGPDGLYYWNYAELAWTVLIDEGSSTGSGYIGDTGWVEDVFVMDPSTYTYQVRTVVELNWN